MSSDTLDKSALRRTIRHLSTDFPEPLRIRESQDLCRRLLHHPLLRAARCVLLFSPLPDEPDITPLLSAWSSQKQILLPVIPSLSGNEPLRLKEYRGPESMQPGPYHILEPSGDDYFTAYSQITAAVIPGMAFDDDGHRLGRGKGYYDRLMSHPDLGERIYKIGICFSYQRVAGVPVLPHDILMDEVFIGN